ncbi:hypothetical protein WAF17_21795 [Bernardetia sp. ABR2-2B]|uniref:hypothetical protein n=1 Tax=Bernardetia sp. ABR2-2B TaxID=3127472 RepID=UPI0030D12940
MQKRNYFIHLIFIVFISLFISACQDIQEEVEDGIDEIDDETEFSCFTTRINYYDENDELTRYSNRAYTQDKKMLYDSTFNADDNSVRTVESYTYDGRSLVVRNYRTRSGQFALLHEYFYEEDKLLKIVDYDIDRNVLVNSIHIYTGELLTKIEYYNGDNEPTGLLINEYDGQNIIKRTSYGANNELINSRRYEYQSNVLVKESLYDANEELVKYYLISDQNNTITKQAYDEEGNILSEKTVRRYDSNNNTIYSLNQFEVGNYSESNYTISYNEYDYIIGFVIQTTRFTNGTILFQSYTRREDVNVECY